MENLSKRPSKGILRFSRGSSRSNSLEKDIKWDETNIQQTLHPDDKDYGYMKIDEPPTPYNRSPHGRNDDNSDDESESDPHAKTVELLERVSKKIKEPPIEIGTDLMNAGNVGDLEASTSSNNDEAQNEGKSNFELLRKQHYNEFHALQLAKKLMQKEMDEDDDDGNDEEDEDLEENNESKSKVETKSNEDCEME